MKGYDTLGGQPPSAPPPPYSYHYGNQQQFEARPLDSFVSRQPTTPGYIIPQTTTTVHIPRHMTTRIHHVRPNRDCCCCCCTCPFWVCCLIVGLVSIFGLVSFLTRA